MNENQVLLKCIENELNKYLEMDIKYYPALYESFIVLYQALEDK